MTLRKTQKQKILECIQETPKIKVAEIVATVGGKYAVISSTIGKMKKAGLITNPSHGHYSLTQKGIELLSNHAYNAEEVQMPSIKTNSNITDKKIISVTDFELDSLDTIIMLRNKYGKTKLLALINKIKRAIE